MTSFLRTSASAELPRTGTRFVQKKQRHAQAFVEGQCNPIAWTRSAPPTRAGLDRATCGRGRTLARRAARARAHRVAAAPRIDRVWCDPVPHVAPAPLLSRDPAGAPTRSRADSIRTDS